MSEPALLLADPWKSSPRAKPRGMRLFSSLRDPMCVAGDPERIPGNWGSLKAQGG